MPNDPQENRRGLVVAIDGPAGAGKSTVARRVAAALDYIYIDSGAMYRAVTHKALKEGVSLDDAEALGDLADKSRIEFRRPAPAHRRLGEDSEAPVQVVLLDSEDVTAPIRHPEVTAAVSVVAAVPAVRLALRQQQRDLARPGGVVMDGRDIGSAVLPDADRKFFVTAALDERARRRRKELELQGHSVAFAQVREQIARRDHMDSSRAVSPLVQAPDAIVVDTTDRDVDEVVEVILTYCRRS